MSAGCWKVPRFAVVAGLLIVLAGVAWAVTNWIDGPMDVHVHNEVYLLNSQFTGGVNDYFQKHMLYSSIDGGGWNLKGEVDNNPWTWNVINECETCSARWHDYAYYYHYTGPPDPGQNYVQQSNTIGPYYTP